MSDLASSDDQECQDCERGGNSTLSLKDTNLLTYLPVDQLWDKIDFKLVLALFSRSLVAFGLNALYNRQQVGGAWGPWDSSNAQALIDFTVEQGIQIEAWELGNKLLC